MGAVSVFHALCRGEFDALFDHRVDIEQCVLSFPSHSLLPFQSINQSIHPSTPPSQTHKIHPTKPPNKPPPNPPRHQNLHPLPPPPARPPHHQRRRNQIPPPQPENPMGFPRSPTRHVPQRRGLSLRRGADGCGYHDEFPARYVVILSFQCGYDHYYCMET